MEYVQSICSFLSTSLEWIERYINNENIQIKYSMINDTFFTTT